MQKDSKETILFYTLMGFAAVVLIASVCTIISTAQHAAGNIPAFGGAPINVPQFASASSSSFALTTSSSKQLLATSSKRVAATVQTINCATGGVLYLNANNDAAAAAGSGIYIAASSTLSFATYPEANPVPTGALQGITGVGNCSVLVTEWRTQ